jgi:hypothetical protein
VSKAGWTLETLKEHFEALRADDKEAIAAALAAAEKAVLKAEVRTQADKEASNEIRGAMLDAQAHFADKEATDRRLTNLENASLANASKSIGATQLYAAAAAVVVAVAAIMGIVFGFGGVH